VAKVRVEPQRIFDQVEGPCRSLNTVDVKVARAKAEVACP